MNPPKMQTSSGDSQRRRVDHSERSLDHTQQSANTTWRRQSGKSSENEKMELCVCKANIFVSNGWDLENMGNTQRKSKLLFPFLHWNTSGYGFVLKITACCYTLISPLTTTSWDTFSRASDIVHFTIESWIFKYSGTHKNKNEFLIHR